LPPYDEVALPDRSYSAAEVDEALAALVEPGRLAHAQDVVVHAAPTLQRMLAEALAEGGWFGAVHDAEINRVAGEQDEGERASAVGTLVAEQTRLGMFVGVAVGFELAHELALGRESSTAAGRDEVGDGQEPGRREPGGRESGGRESGGREPHHNQPSTEEH
jgi:hypothetical protein